MAETETTYRYWIAFLVDYPDSQFFRASAHDLYQPMDTLDGVENAQSHVEISEGHDQGSVTALTWKRLS